MQVNDVITRLHDAAAASKNDALANIISKLAGRLAHQGAPFEKPLSETEMTLISKYAGIN
jgi:hypothetical protein